MSERFNLHAGCPYCALTYPIRVDTQTLQTLEIHPDAEIHIEWHHTRGDKPMEGIKDE